MAYIEIDAAEVATGEGVSSTVGTKIRDNFIDHEDRIDNLEGTNLNYRPIEFVVTGDYLVADAVLYDRITFDVDITANHLIIPIAGTSGTTEIDIEYKRGVGAWTSIFSTKPAVIYTAGDLGLSSEEGTGETKGVVSTVSLLAGDYLRLNIDSRQTGSLSPGFIVQLEIEQP